MADRSDIVRPRWLHVIDDPGPELAGADPTALLASLPGPAAIRLPGARSDRCRIAVTLLHGNEPSGTAALHRLLGEARDFAVDLWVIVAAIDAARQPPGFAHRFLPGRYDLNRVFADADAGSSDPDLGFAGQLLELFDQLPPIEALVDVHNNTGRNPPYTITTRLDPRRLDLASLFAERTIETNLRLGTLLETVEDRFPGVSVEAGRAGDEAADECAYRGLSRFARLDSFEGARGEMTIYSDPIRVELRPGATIDFAPAPSSGYDLVLTDEIDSHNFDLVERGTPLGWVTNGWWPLQALDEGGRELSRELFDASDGALRAAVDMVPIMMTRNPIVAVQDCLFYVVRSPRRRVPTEGLRSGGGDRAGSSGGQGEDGTGMTE